MMSNEWRFLFLFILQFSNFTNGAGRLAECKLRLDEVSTLRPDSSVHGSPTGDHAYYFSLRLVACSENEHPSLTSYSVAILRLIGSNSPHQIGYFDLNGRQPIMKTGTFNWYTKFPEVHERVMIGNFPATRIRSDGVLIDWTKVSDMRAAVAPSRRLYPDDDTFVTLFILLKYDKRNKEDHENLQRLLGIKFRDPMSHVLKFDPFSLSAKFDANWEAIASKAEQVVGLSVNSSFIASSRILAGLQRSVSDFTIATLPDEHGGIRLDIPAGEAVRQCANLWVLTQQSSDLSTPVHCDEQVDDIRPLTVVPDNHDWTKDFSIYSTDSDDQRSTADPSRPDSSRPDGSNDGSIDIGSEVGSGGAVSPNGSPHPDSRECSRGPSPKKPRLEDAPQYVELLIFREGRTYVTSTTHLRCYMPMVNHHHQVAASLIIINDDGERGRLHNLTSRAFYTNPKEMSRLKDGGLTKLSPTKTNCLHLFDMFSHIIFGNVIRANDIMEFIMKRKMRKTPQERAAQEARWNEKEEFEDGSVIPCYELYTDLPNYLPFHIAMSLTVNGKEDRYSFESGIGNRQETPVIYIDADKMQLFDQGNGLIDKQLMSLLPYNEGTGEEFKCQERDEEMRSEGTEYCGDGGGGESELLRLTRESHEMLTRLTEGTTSAAEKLFLEKKMRTFREQHAFLQNLNADQMKEIADSNLISEDIMENLFSDSRLTYFDVKYDKEKKKLHFSCTACTARGLSNVKHKRSVEWEVSSNTEAKFKSILGNMRDHHLTHHHRDSVRILETEAEERFLKEYWPGSDSLHSKKDPTDIMLMIAYTMAKLAIPGYRFENICQLMRDAGIPIGHTNTCRTSFMRVIMMMFTRMKNDWIEHMVTNKIPFGMELDTSTDSQGRVVLMIFLTAVVEGYPREMFYAAIYLQDGETGETIYTSIINKFKEDRWLQHLDDYLIGVSTDGDRKMIGHILGVAGRMKNRLLEHRRNSRTRGIPLSIPHIHCAGHRVELGLKDGFKALAMDHELQHGWSEVITDVINQVANLWSVVAPKRLESLRATAKEMQLSGSVDTVLRLKRDYDPRWTSTGLSARKTATRMFLPMWQNLMENDVDPSTIRNAADRKLAIRGQTFLHIFRNISFYAHLTFEVGILDCVQFLSLEAQRVDGSLIDFPRAFSEFEKCVTQFCKDPFNPYQPKMRETKEKKKTKTDTVVNFMRNVVVMEPSGPVPIAESEEGKKALFGQRSADLDALRFKLTFTTQPSPPGSQSSTVDPDAEPKGLYFYHIHQSVDELDQRKVPDSVLNRKIQAANMVFLDEKERNEYGKAVIAKMKSRFYDVILEWAASFTVEKLIFDRSFGTASGGNDKKNRRLISQMFIFDAAKVESDILTLRQHFEVQVSKEKREELKNAPTDIKLFHAALLGKECYGKELQDLISNIITLPISSAGVERGYSISNNYMSKRRSSLNIPHLEAYVFLNINGPEPHTFVTKKYKVEWLATRQPTEFRDPNEPKDVNEEDEDSYDFTGWSSAFSGKKNVPRLSIFD